MTLKKNCFIFFHIFIIQWRLLYNITYFTWKSKNYTILLYICSGEIRTITLRSLAKKAWSGGRWWVNETVRRLLSWGHLAISGDIFCCHNWRRGMTGRGQGCCWTTHRTDPFPLWRINYPAQMSVVLRLKSPILLIFKFLSIDFSLAFPYLGKAPCLDLHMTRSLPSSLFKCLPLRAFSVHFYTRFHTQASLQPLSTASLFSHNECYLSCIFLVPHCVCCEQNNACHLINSQWKYTVRVNICIFIFIHAHIWN
jgi:hypothetical protein